MAEPALQSELDAVREDLSKLREDMAGVVTALKESSRARAAEAKESALAMAGTLTEDLQRGFEGLRERSRDSMKTLEAQIEERPLLALVIAFGAGILLGKLFDRR